MDVSGFLPASILLLPLTSCVLKPERWIRCGGEPQRMMKHYQVLQSNQQGQVFFFSISLIAFNCLSSSSSISNRKTHNAGAIMYFRVNRFQELRESRKSKKVENTHIVG